MKYVNNTKHDIVIAVQDGIKVLLPKRPSNAARELIVQKTYKVSDVEASRLSDLFTRTDHPASSAIRKLKDEFEAQLVRNTHGGMVLVLTSRFDEELLENGDGVFYCADLDIVISILSYEATPSHPHSSEPDRAVLMDNGKGVYESANFGIEYIDNEGNRGDRYFKIAGRVIKLTPMRNPRYYSGIRFFMTNVAFITHNNERVIKCFGEDFIRPLERVYRHYAFENFPEDHVEKKFGLYKTPEEAENSEERIATENKSELARLEHRNAVLSKENAEAAQKAKQKQLEFEKLITELTTAHSALELERERERQRVKDHYETKSHRRKDTSEGVKFLPILLTGMAAVFGTAWAFL